MGQSRKGKTPKNLRAEKEKANAADKPANQKKSLDKDAARVADAETRRANHLRSGVHVKDGNNNSQLTSPDGDDTRNGQLPFGAVAGGVSVWDVLLSLGEDGAAAVGLASKDYKLLRGIAAASLANAVCPDFLRISEYRFFATPPRGANFNSSAFIGSAPSTSDDKNNKGKEDDREGNDRRNEKGIHGSGGDGEGGEGSDASDRKSEKDKKIARNKQDRKEKMDKSMNEKGVAKDADSTTAGYATSDEAAISPVSMASYFFKKSGHYRSRNLPGADLRALPTLCSAEGTLGPFHDIMVEYLQNKSQERAEALVGALLDLNEYFRSYRRQVLDLAAALEPSCRPRN